MKNIANFYFLNIITIIRVDFSSPKITSIVTIYKIIISDRVTYRILSNKYYPVSAESIKNPSTLKKDIENYTK